MKLASFTPRLQRSEASICRSWNRWGRYAPVRRYFALVSRLGDGMAWYALMGSVALFGGPQGIGVSAQLAATGVVALLLYLGLKRHTRRPRPCASDRRIRALVQPLDEFSFPSGHTLHAAAFSGVALTHYPELAWLLLPFSASVAVSRVVLGLHYPSDVLAASALGGLLAGLSVWVWPF